MKSFTALALFSLLGLAQPCFAAVQAPYTTQNGMVASDHYLASQVGAEILKKGGNAIDAAIATSLSLSVIRNQSTGIGGGGFMLIRMHDGRTRVLDYRETAPAQAHRDMYLNTQGEVIPNLSTIGYKAAGVPGLLAGLEAASKEFGSQPLKSLFQPAIQIAEKGFASDAHYLEASEVALKRGVNPEFKATYFCNQKPCQIGETVKLPQLAKTLKLIADQGIQVFYRGSLAKKIAAAMQANGGLITEADLAQYHPKIRSPLKGSYRGYEILTMPPPSSGGTALLEILNLLEPQELGWNSTGFGSAEHVMRVTEAMKHAYADRAEFLGDPDFVKVPVEELISKDYALSLLPRIKAGLKHTLAREAYGKKGLSYSALQAPIEDHGTTHFSVVDRWGNMVSSTETINTYFGSLTLVPGTGILLNNQMDDFSSKPGSPNAFGLIGNQANAIAPGKKPLSSMTPTLVLKAGKPFMSLGASGGPRIISGTLNTLINVIDFGMNIEEAVSSPRFHHQWVPDSLFIEKWMPVEVREVLKAHGHHLEITGAESTVQALLLENQQIAGASDPRKGGHPAGY
ncbi:gamma-glutamyltransferase [bacterium (Candidatus Blackallbacteria) CG17_big_fil_post_rev_8_21_14_2_50_48_46]|uniref:Glutathione hydrolase proenzyme n=1 Tax=bacterium (Candidatus Blackallbacteria) CG17_big_fil_post_rev_8_21_14_2_50_48_46 TaxID=2014261 RepID=A0A2M7G752_9BACT|nr:MAG: gamma-glutamyltransferase [bacterium (Candidatus Blackallbacteria) CG18_big_fil_WC_8_21_14_2_50_49_26]PIW17516.1 MAG: gamma-glutamyltransferase [bacterium (Candidatus Blackallbacteria) CG17_big_fil_post_rev_8_21_14_2_50_48_46]PIW48370.1 MAG: gamma-glutamyltransferase [bacterium (Candidatus Blackallbacteria) CG13_big_fil_rev_8_21_14_2_50_49_14]